MLHRSAELMVRLLTRLLRFARPDVPERVVEVDTALLWCDIFCLSSFWTRWVRCSISDASCATFADSSGTIEVFFE